MRGHGGCGPVRVRRTAEGHVVDPRDRGPPASPRPRRGHVAAGRRLPRCLPALSSGPARCDSGGSAVTPPADGGDARSNLCSNESNTTPVGSRHPAESRIFARISDTARETHTSPQLHAPRRRRTAQRTPPPPGVSRHRTGSDYRSCSSLSAQPAPTWKTGSETKKSCGLDSDSYRTVTKCVHNHPGTWVVLLGGSASCEGLRAAG